MIQQMLALSLAAMLSASSAPLADAMPVTDAVAEPSAPVLALPAAESQWRGNNDLRLTRTQSGWRLGGTIGVTASVHNYLENTQGTGGFTLQVGCGAMESGEAVLVDCGSTGLGVEQADGRLLGEARLTLGEDAQPALFLSEGGVTALALPLGLTDGTTLQPGKVTITLPDSTVLSLSVAAQTATINPRVCRAYLMQDGLRLTFPGCESWGGIYDRMGEPHYSLWMNGQCKADDRTVDTAYLRRHDNHDGTGSASNTYTGSTNLYYVPSAGSGDTYYGVFRFTLDGVSYVAPFHSK